MSKTTVLYITLGDGLTKIPNLKSTYYLKIWQLLKYSFLPYIFTASMVDGLDVRSTKYARTIRERIPDVAMYLHSDPGGWVPPKNAQKAGLAFPSFRSSPQPQWKNLLLKRKSILTAFQFYFFPLLHTSFPCLFSQFELIQTVSLPRAPIFSNKTGTSVDYQ